MQAVTSQCMRNIENAAFSRKYTAESLMDQAGKRIAEKICHYHPHRNKVTAYLGKGNNAGDALVALKHLKEAGWEIILKTHLLQRDFTPLVQKKLLALDIPLSSNKQCPPSHSILLDALVGIGADGPLREPLVRSAIEINHCRNFKNCITISLDIPSGVNTDTGIIYQNAVVADQTMTIGYPKVGLLSHQAVSHVGSICHIPLEGLSLSDVTLPATHHLISPHSIFLKRRSFDTHKGQAGRVGIWAGSEGMLGAAALAAKAALRSGAGLVTVFIAPTLYPTLSTMVPHEIMVKPTVDPTVLLSSSFDSLIIGPGIGSPVASLRNKLFQVIAQASIPLVLDADMLNILAEENKQELIHAGCILTPHPGEMLRLFPSSSDLNREATSQSFVKQYPCTLIHKGTRSIVSHHAIEYLFINSTGTPAMATAGQGDVLSGLIGGLCAQGYPAIEAAKIALWAAGESSQLAVSHQYHTEETLTASDTIDHLAHAFTALHRRT